MLDLKTDLFVDGSWRAGAARIAVENPATGETLASVAVADENDCGAAVNAASAAASGWAATPPRTRAEILRRAFDRMQEASDDLARLITLENGKALCDSRSEVSYAAEFFRWFSEEAVRIPGEFRQAPAGDKHIVVTSEPIGVSLLVTPWNFPAAMATRKLAPALAAGCTVILKPAMETPLSALAIAQILHDSGVPRGVVNVVLPVPVAEPVRRMLSDDRVRNLSFTGSTEVGKELLHIAAGRVLRTSMELGGNAPLLVLSDANIDQAVDGALAAKMRNGGAACTAANRFFVAKEVLGEFTNRFAVAMSKLRVAPGLTPGCDIGSLVSRSEQRKVGDLVERAVACGSRLVVGGTIPPGAGAFYPPTVLADVPSDAPVLAHEIFGPVAPIVAVEDDDEAVALANASEHGLVAYVFSSDVARAMRVGRRLEAGMVAINRGSVSDAAAPFGGVKQSGLGREGGFHGIHEFLQTKYMALDP